MGHVDAIPNMSVFGNEYGVTKSGKDNKKLWYGIVTGEFGLFCTLTFKDMKGEEQRKI